MDTPLALQIGGLPIPDAGPLFLAALTVHVAAALTAIGAGLAAATAGKRPGRHPRAGTVYLYAIGTVSTTATVMALLRWHHDWRLFVIATVAFALALAGRTLRRRRPLRWLTWHGSAMAGSYAALFTGFYVDNGPHLPLWDQLPHLAYWLLPASVAAPLTLRALARNGALRSASRRARSDAVVHPASTRRAPHKQPAPNALPQSIQAVCLLLPSDAPAQEISPQRDAPVASTPSGNRATT